MKYNVSTADPRTWFPNSLDDEQREEFVADNVSSNDDDEPEYKGFLDEYHQSYTFVSIDDAVYLIDDEFDVFVFPWFIKEAKTAICFVQAIEDEKRRSFDNGMAAGVEKERNKIASYAKLINQGVNDF